MARKDRPYLPLYIQDFTTDEKLMECSASATGVYIRIMCIMHKSEIYGLISLKQKYKQNGKQNSSDIEIFASMIAKHVPYEYATVLDGLRELINEEVLQIKDGQLIQKRMFHDGIKSSKNSLSGQKGGLATQQNAKAKIKANRQAISDNEIDNDIETLSLLKDR